ncbi:auxin-responsive protein SAUR32-like [Hordeum vulgare subsp. vulgare]|uniref:Auxin-responsive protein SAUR32 n=1 Tax=Hordeum vulgare subsp. vulgare TaxID=112509 RepID=A0A8I6YY03_HORVV|nr:auxin-responsive protein SAUR32-like [Hordeum vulgare subsp. vulgare]XP_044953359.1 auxin-responsive protein SAUR32-like [Hordeum vulgare subsp. vulgare]XP_044953361.1 auxin-responsive protein SAUR32-like [Hordeum vulgare subsp. vulgare]XP_044953370.1 auxin-responsive protein SAUR32-like [Hordeum vulgare subsp. vulgare]XP_044953373.1 auxin-responsive protein SAUR32-like [Hordeum vulgare subsp. vulgare]
MQGDQAEKRGKVKKGWLAVRVGQAEQQGDGFRRFVIPIAYLYHPLFQRLLEAARDTYGYDSAGPLRLPCSVDEFLRLRALVDRETAHSHSSSSHRVHAGAHPEQGYSFSPCARAKITS